MFRLLGVPIHDLPLSYSRALRLGVSGFVVAAVGAGFGLLIDYGPRNAWSLVAFGAVVIGVIAGFVGIAWGWLTLAAQNRKEPRRENDAL